MCGHVKSLAISSSALDVPLGHHSQVCPGARPPTTTRLMPWKGIPTWGAKAEGVGCAEAAAADPGSEGDLILARAGLVLAGGGHQANVGVQLDQEPVLQHPHHHLNELGLQDSSVRPGALGEADPPTTQFPS